MKKLILIAIIILLALPLLAARKPPQRPDSLNVYHAEIDTAQINDITILDLDGILAGSASASQGTAFYDSIETCDLFDPVIYQTSGRLTAASASVIDSSYVIGVSLVAATSVTYGLVLERGWISNSTWTWTPGSAVWLAVYGGLTQTQPTGTDQAVYYVGMAKSATVIKVDPSFVPVELE